MNHSFTSTLFVLLITSICFSQNLVLNGSFEDTEKCVAYIGRFDKVLNWSKPNRGTTDLFNDCIKSEAGIPKNYNGNQRALDGHNYAGIYTFSNHDYREYIQGRTTKRLEKGKKYKLTFHISLAEKSDFAIKNFAVLLSKNQLNFYNSDKISSRLLKKDKSNKYKLYPIENKRYYDNTERWIPIEVTFTASGYEEYITIGNFNRNSKTDKIKISRIISQNISYYYIDDVSLVDLASQEIMEKEENSTQIKPKEKSSFKINSIYTLKSIQFEFDKSTLIENSTKELDELIIYLKQNPELKIQINGHTDYLGKAAYNQKLSEDRAKSVAGYLISKGISKKRITSKGYGESQPIDPNEPEDAQAKNRRVEFILSN